MKFKIVIFSIVLFLAVTVLKAQPDCSQKYSPFYICQSDYVESDYIFYGEIVSPAKVDHKVVIAGKTTYFRTIVEVKNSFKGTPPTKFEIFLDYDIICQGMPGVKSMQIFNVHKTIVGNQTMYYVQHMSRPLTDYSSKALNKVFNNIKDVLNNKKENILEGEIQEFLDKRTPVQLKNEELDKHFLNPTTHKPISGVFIEAVNEQSGKTYSTKSATGGKYRFGNIPRGKYKIRAFLGDGRKVEEEVVTDGSFCKRYQFLILY